MDTINHNVSGSASQMLRITSTLDFGIVRLTAHAGQNPHRALEVVSHRLQQLRQDWAYMIRSAAALTSEFLPGKVLGHVTAHTSRKTLLFIA
jgi:hypothetical protein